MMFDGTPARVLRWALFAIPLMVLGSACTDTEVVFRDRELFEEPLPAAMSFLGYTNADTKLTVCGNCHVEKQGDWEGTAHADAWDGLQSSGGAQSFCEGCHTVSELGNTVGETAGYNATQEERYEDVQCESCHGPGLEHVQNPTDLTVPLAAIAVGVDLTTGCGECHSGAHHPFVEEWAVSRHGEGGRDSFRTRDGCSACHGGEGALAAFGVNTEYLEQGDPEANLPITCAVCHDPHSADNEGQLRFPIGVLDIDQNLCMKCHQRRAVPDPSSSRGPHSPQGPLLIGEIGEVGWTPPNFQYNVESIRGTHGSQRNPRLCAGCHVNAFEIDDPDTGDFVFSATGHLFKPIPCVDAQGVPNAGDCELTVEARSFDSCASGSCHGDETAALTAMLVAQERIRDLVEELDALLDLVPEDQFDTDDGVFTTAEGANFNAGLGAIESSAIHNPFLTEALLTASIRQVREDYGLAPQTGVRLEQQLTAPSGVGR